MSTGDNYNPSCSSKLSSSQLATWRRLCALGTRGTISGPLKLCWGSNWGIFVWMLSFVDQSVTLMDTLCLATPGVHSFNKPNMHTNGDRKDGRQGLCLKKEIIDLFQIPQNGVVQHGGRQARRRIASGQFNISGEFTCLECPALYYKVFLKEKLKKPWSHWWRLD